MINYLKYKNCNIDWIDDKSPSKYWITKIPEEWSVLRVKNLVDNNKYYQIGDGDHGQIKTHHYRDKGIPYIRVQNIGKNSKLDKGGLVYLSKETHDNNDKSKLFPGDILIAKTGATVGKVCLLDSEFSEYNTTSSVGKITIDKKKFFSKFFYYYFQSKIFQEFVWMTSIQKSAQPGFNIDDLKEFPVIIPTFEEQKKITHYLDYKISLLDNIGKNIQSKLINEYQITLISYLTSGVFDVRKEFTK